MQDYPLAAFDNLISKAWVAEGNWGNGQVFKQETSFEYSLDQTIVIAKTKGFVDQENTKVGDRNYGIRQYNPQTKEVSFHEFDVFGGHTTGMVRFEGNNIKYYYEYLGSQLVDLWKYVDDESYELVIAEAKDGEPGTVYMRASVKLKK